MEQTDDFLSFEHELPWISMQTFSTWQPKEVAVRGLRTLELTGEWPCVEILKGVRNQEKISNF